MRAKRNKNQSGPLLLILALGVVAGAAIIPFTFESSTILYRFGWDRRLLRAGQIAGMMAGCGLMLQLVLSARLKFLDRVYGLSRLFQVHRQVGIILTFLVIMHPILVFLPEGRYTIPLQLSYWPEFVGLALLMLISFTVATSLWRTHLRFAFHHWWPVHRLIALLSLTALWLHLWSVNDILDRDITRTAAYAAITLCSLLFIWTRSRPLRNRCHAYRILEARPAAVDATSLRIVPLSGRLPEYAPAQFAFLTVLATGISREEHPFTIASAPAQGAYLEFIVRTTGDWTGKLANVQPGATVLLNGPYGCFNHLTLDDTREILLIAGGVGITPLLSMLRQMAADQDRRKLTLLWANRSTRHIAVPDEFRCLADQLMLRIVHVITRDPQFAGETGHLHEGNLQRLLAGCSRSAAVFICGPAQMMAQVRRALLALGFSRRLIFMERFYL